MRSGAQSFCAARWLLLFVWLTAVSGAWAQTATIGSTVVPVVGPATSSYLYGPIYRSAATSIFNYSRYAHLYTPAELGVPVGTVITQLAWLKSDAGELTGNNVFTVLLNNSTATALTSGATWANLSAGATSVYTSSTQQFTGAAGTYFSVTLSRPFTYTGGNLLVLLDHQKLGTATAAVNFVTNPAAGLAVGAADSNPITASTPLTTSSYGDRRPTLRITYTPATACTAPPAAGTTLASATAICPGSTVNLSLQGASFGTGLTYQWQQSTDGTTYTDIAGATNLTYTTPALMATRYYRARLTCSGQAATSTPVHVTVGATTYASLPVVESFENTWLSRCNTREVPNSNWSNTPAAGNNSWRREDDGSSAGWVSPTSWSYSPTGSQGTHSARFHSGQASSGSVGTLDLFVNLSQAGGKQLFFDYLNTTGSDSLTIHVSTDGGASFGPALLRLGVSGTSTTGFSSRFLLLNTTSATAVIRFRGRADFGVTDIGLDNIRLESSTGCLPPVNLTVTSTTTTSAIITWQGTGTGAYNIQYGPSGFTPGQGTTLTNVTSPYTLTGLQPGMQYQFYVSQICGATQSNLVGPVGFTTRIANDDPCGALSLTLGSDCTTPVQTTNAGATTTTPSGYTNGGSTGCGPSSLTLPKDVWFKFRTATSGLGSTEVTLTVIGAPANVMRVFTGATCTGILAPVISGCAASNSSSVAAPVLALTNLTPNTDYYVQVSGYSNTATLGNFTMCAVAPSNCPVPVGLEASTITATTATLTWSVNSTTPSGTFTLEYGPQNFTLGTGTRITGVSGLARTLTGLNPDTQYCFYVRQECGPASGNSAFSGPVCFRTTIAPTGNDEPCGATALTVGSGAYGPVLNASNIGATNTTPNGYSSIGCSISGAPKDVWFTFTTPAGTSGVALLVTGNPAGQVRVFSATSCNGPFTQIGCKAGPGPNTAAGNLALTGLAANTTYYVAVSGFGTNDFQGAFTVQAGTGGVLLSTGQGELVNGEVRVYPNPSHDGHLNLVIRGAGSEKTAQAVLVNSLGQQVLQQMVVLQGGQATQALAVEQLAKGFYTLRLRVGHRTITRKVVLD